MTTVSQLRGTALVGLSGLLFGSLGFLGTKLLAFNFTVENMLFWRFFVATACILIICLTFRKNIFQQDRQDISILKTLLFATVSYSGSSAFYFLASKYIGTGIGMVIFFSFPVFVTLFTWVLDGWHINKYAVASVIAVVLGLLFLKGDGDNALDLTGIILGMIAAISYAVYVYGSQHSAKTIDSLLLTLLVCFGNTIIFLLWSWGTHSLVLPTSLSAWLYICAIGIVATVLPIQLMLNGLKYISPVKASVLSVFEPVVTVLIGLMLLGETLSYGQFIGIVIVLFGAVLIQFERTQKEGE